jgi:flagellar biosynthesis chaperone FliJ
LHCFQNKQCKNSLSEEMQEREKAIEKIKHEETKQDKYNKQTKHNTHTQPAQNTNKISKHFLSTLPQQAMPSALSSRKQEKQQTQTKPQHLATAKHNTAGRKVFVIKQIEK